MKPHPLAGSETARIFYGGPDREPRALRDLLERRVDAVEPGGSILWMTYYFRDEKLAEALARARRRGVDVKLCVEGSPRLRHANDRVISRLSGPDGIGDGLRIVRHWLPAHLHTKLFCFSGPEAVALVGSFNPSGNEPDDIEVIADIGDQDRGHNLLVEITHPELVQALVQRARAIHAGASPFGRLAAPGNATVRSDGYEAFFFPRRGGSPLDRRLNALGRGSTLRIAASHVRDKALARLLVGLVGKGASVELLTHHTFRRSPEHVVDYLRQGGVVVYRYDHPEELPMHSKFILAETPAGSWAAFGSYNLKRRSRWLNQELLVFSDRPEIWSSLDRRWQDIISEPWCRQ